MKNQVFVTLLAATALTGGAGAATASAQSGGTGPIAGPAGSPPADLPMSDRPIPGGPLLRADSNHDGIVTRDEVIADADQRFDRRDTDGDGRIGRDERRDSRDAHRGPPPPPPGGGNPPPPPPGDADGAPPPPPPSGADDRPRRPDRDGRMGGHRPPRTREEARDRALRMFDRADTNHDGRVDQQEIAAMRLLMRARAADRAADRGDDAPGRAPPPGLEQE